MATTIRAMLNTDRCTVSGYYPLVIRVIHNRKKKLIYSPYKFSELEFDSRQEKVRWSKSCHYSSTQVRRINCYIASEKRQLERVVKMLHKNMNGLFEVNDIASTHGVNKTYKNLFEYIDKEISIKHNTQCFGMQKLYRTTKESLKRFTKGRDVLLKDITFTFVSSYIDYLKGSGISVNTIQMYLRNIRAIYNKARKEGLIVVKDSPFENVKMNGTTTVKRAVNKDVMRRIAFADFSENKMMESVRDLFLFSFYTRGMSVVDILYLKHHNIRNGIIYYARNKTNQNIQISITAPLQTLINKYRSNSIYVWPYLTEGNKKTQYRQYCNALALINKYLKRIGNVLNLDIPLTTYVARHSWATIAKNEGTPIAAISEGLGHTTEKTTQIYLKAFDNSIIDEVNAKVTLL